MTLALGSAQAAPALLFSQQSMTSSAPCKTYGCVLLKKKTNADDETGKPVNTSYAYSLKNTSLRILVFRDLSGNLSSLNAYGSEINPKEARTLTTFITAVTGRPLKKDLYLNCVSGPVGYGTRTELEIPLDRFSRDGVEMEAACSLDLDSKEPGFKFSFYVSKSVF